MLTCVNRLVKQQIMCVICNMQERNYKTILYFIAGVIGITLAMQAFWNYKNYQTGKQQLVNEVQNSIDNAVDTYYADLATKNMIGITLTDEGVHSDQKSLDSLFYSFENLDPFAHNSDKNVHFNINISDTTATRLKIFSKDGIKNQDTLFTTIKATDSLKRSLANWNLTTDSLRSNPLAKLTSRVIYALTEEMVDIKTLDTLFKKELKRKEINIQHQLELAYSPFSKSTKNIRIPATFETKQEILTTFSSADVLPKNTQIFVKFSNVTGTILKRNSIGLLLSFLFSMAIILSLLYLLKVIKNQKQLAEIKNDLISNITHEFKTPIATIGAAMEGIKVFNTDNDTEKTLKYATISATQVEKLNGMVEKLLETATLDSERLKLNYEDTDLIHLLNTIAAKELFALPDKTITFNALVDVCTYPIDRFHFENAMNNILDNALKYGGNKIEISLVKGVEDIEIIIADSGSKLTATHSKQIFNKFYRVPKGNTHDIKGFGIGLFYTKAIIEKHRGEIAVSVKPTSFNITLPL